LGLRPDCTVAYGQIGGVGSRVGAFARTRVGVYRLLANEASLNLSCNIVLAHSISCGPLRSRVRDKVEAVKIHHLAPRNRKVPHELLLRVRASVDFRDGSELRVRTEDDVDGGAGPLARTPLLS